MNATHHQSRRFQLCLLTGVGGWLLLAALQPALAQGQADDLSITGVLDVHGNTLSLGSWLDSALTPGVVWKYEESAATDHPATLSLSATRPSATWLWQRPTSASNAGYLPQMTLSAANKLTLFDPTATTAAPALVLDPMGTSFFTKSVQFLGTNYVMPNQIPTGPSSVLTQGLADARYGIHLNGDSLSMGSGASATVAATALGQSAIASGGASTAVGNDAAASGIAALAAGVHSRASSNASVAVGYNANASGYYSIATGINAVASGQNSFATGMDTVASGVTSFAAGAGAHATNLQSSAIGIYSTSSGVAASAIGGSSLASGGVSSALGWNSQATNTYSVALGFNSVAGGYGAVALGGDSAASGYEAVTVGNASGATGDTAMSLGYHSAATQPGTVAAGSYSAATGGYATALTSSSVASGDYAVAAGRTEAHSQYQFAVGAYGTVGGSPTTWVPTDDLFTVGNGQSAQARSNAFVVKKNGDAQVSGKLTVTGPIILTQPQGDLSMGEFTAQPSPTP